MEEREIRDSLLQELRRWRWWWKVKSDEGLESSERERKTTRGQAGKGRFREGKRIVILYNVKQFLYNIATDRSKYISHRETWIISQQKRIQLIRKKRLSKEH